MNTPFVLNLKLLISIGFQQGEKLKANELFKSSKQQHIHLLIKKIKHTTLSKIKKYLMRGKYAIFYWLKLIKLMFENWLKHFDESILKRQNILSN